MVSLALLLGGTLLEWAKDESLAQWLLSGQVEEVQQQVFERQELAEQVFQELQGMKEVEIYRQYPEFRHRMNEAGMMLYTYYKGRLVLWTDNTVVPADEEEEDDSLSVESYSNGLYLKQTMQDGPNYRYTILIPIQFEFPIENTYLQDKIPLLEPQGTFLVTTHSEEGDFTIHNKAGESLFFLEVLRLPEVWRATAFFYLLGLSLLLMWFHLLIDRQFAIEPKRGWLLVLAVSGALFGMWKVLRWPEGLFQLDLFSPQQYASSWLFNSLGDLMLFVLLLSWLLFLLMKHSPLLYVRNRGSNIALASVLVFSSMLGSLGAFHLLRSLVLNSNISFDITNIFSLDLYSGVGFLIIFLLLMDAVFFILWAYDAYAPLFRSYLGFLPIALGTLFFLPLLLLNPAHSVLIILYPFSIWMVLVLIVRYDRQLFQFNFTMVILFISAIYAAAILYRFNQQKELEAQKLLASTLASERDVIAEYLFQDVQERVKEDIFVKSYYSNPIFGKEFLQKRINQLYFTGYFSKYDLEAYSYGKDEVPLRGNVDHPYSYWMDLIGRNGLEVVDDHLFFIDDPAAVPYYVAVFPIERVGNVLGKLVITFRQKAFFEESIYPELLLERKLRRSIEERDYSYAIYTNDRLVTQAGDYPYPTEANWRFNTAASYSRWVEGKHRHLLHTVNPHSFVLVTMEKKTLLYPLALFSSLFLLFSLLLVAIYGLSLLASLRPEPSRQGQRFGWELPMHPLRNLMFATKLRIFVIGVILISLISIGYATTSYIRYKYNKEQNDELSQKVRGVLNRLEGALHSEEVRLDANDESLVALVRRLSDLYQNDINLYDTHGNLIMSSQPGIFERDIISEKMNGHAFYQLQYLKVSIIIMQESINRLEYLAAYAPLRSEARETLAYLDLPFFAQETELRSDISSFIVTLINLYVLLFILVSFVSILLSSTITRPLAVIRDKMRQLAVGRRNEPIDYSSKDEIGQLVQEYNDMLRKLEDSTRKLRRTEREVAWREMAKQVAHEIKNPLTPMKLSIQQLQRAWKEKADNLDQRFNKVTDIVIKQIDHLSQIATAFSSFAKMPEGESESVNLTEELAGISNLYSTTERISISADLPDEEVITYIDKNQLGRVFNNLIKNAIQAIPDDRMGRIHVSMKRTGHVAEVEVRDNGKGIPEEEQDKVFRPNFSTKTSGMGLGLAMVKSIVESAGGTITFESVADEGTRFFLTFPVYGSEV